jgi:hypothetical protein
MNVHHRAWGVWAVGWPPISSASCTARSFGVAGLDAATRFDAGPAVLSGFVVLQLLVIVLVPPLREVLVDRRRAR